MLSVDNLRIYYRTLAGDVQALDGVTFEAGDGEIMALPANRAAGNPPSARG
jgi:peptide/nickel transport system ATP-binding protein